MSETPVSPRLAPPMAKQPYLERLVINVSHDCNLRCTYCYADTGAYGARRIMLSELTGRSIVDHFFERFERIGKVQFFGGEPFLNAKGIADLCEYVSETCGRNDTPLPLFTVISNGMIVNEQILELIRRYGIVVTVSLDGLRGVNDGQRVYANGKGSFDRVVDNIRILKSHTGQPTQIEGTYTASHVAAGFSLAEFMRFVAGELDVHYLHMPWIMGAGYNGTGVDPTNANVDHVTRVYQEAVSASFSSLKTPRLEDTILISAVDRSLRRALAGTTEPRKHMCPAGSGTLSVGADGKISPCFMFTNKPEFEFGRVGDGNAAGFDRRRAEFVERLKIPAGANAGGFEMGSACAGQNLEVSGRVERMAAASQCIQDAVDAHLRAELATYRADPDLWQWVQVKMMLHQIEVAGASQPSAGC